MKTRDLNGWLDYIQTLHSRTIEMDLERVASVWQQCRLPITCPVITVAGTNGKGSSVAMLEAIYRRAGYKTGTYTSPHLVHYNERIGIAGQAISDVALLAGFVAVEAARKAVPLTYFEFGTVLALYCLQRAQLDIMLLEVGLGGRLDATNIVDNDLALITSISIDHASWLGNDRETIAAEKAGIIKAGGLAVYADNARPRAIDKLAASKQAALYAAGRDFSWQIAGAPPAELPPAELPPADVPPADVSLRGATFNWQLSNGEGLQGLSTGLLGAHQVANASGVLMAVHLLQNRLPVAESAVRLGLKTAKVAARQQWIAGTPNLLLDVSHNQDSIAQLLATLPAKIAASEGKIRAVFGALEDKNISAAIRQLLPLVDAWYLTTIAGERGQSAADLLAVLNQQSSLQARLYATPVGAFEAAKADSSATDIVLIFGSFHVVGAIIGHLAYGQIACGQLC